jgi:hypothetical protein
MNTWTEDGPDLDDFGAVEVLWQEGIYHGRMFNRFFIFNARPALSMRLAE